MKYLVALLAIILLMTACKAPVDSPQGETPQDQTGDTNENAETPGDDTLDTGDTASPGDGDADPGAPPPPPDVFEEDSGGVDVDDGFEELDDVDGVFNELENW